MNPQMLKALDHKDPATRQVARQRITALLHGPQASNTVAAFLSQLPQADARQRRHLLRLLTQAAAEKENVWAAIRERSTTSVVWEIIRNLFPFWDNHTTVVRLLDLMESLTTAPIEALYPLPNCLRFSAQYKASAHLHALLLPVATLRSRALRAGASHLAAELTDAYHALQTAAGRFPNLPLPAAAETVTNLPRPATHPEPE